MANVILTNLSIISDKASKCIYKSDTGNISGVQTNEAPIKYLISYLHRNNKATGRIIAVATDEAKTSFDNICTVLKEYGQQEKIPLPVPEIVKTTENTISETIQDIVNMISSDDEVYIDTTGGFRNSAYLLMGVVRVLEYSDIKVKKAVYSNYQKERIEDITELYRMFDLINAVNTFTSVGNSYELEEYFKNTNNDTVKRTITAMNEFSDELTLCRTSKLNEVIDKLNYCLDELSDVQSDSKDIILFKSLSEAIRSKFNIHGERISCPDIVMWCVQNRLIQQAVTIYVEKMPEYFYNKKFYTVSDYVINSVKNKKSKFDYYYELFYTTLMQEAELPEEIQLLIEIIKNTCTGKKASPSPASFRIKPNDDEVVGAALRECSDTLTFMNRVSRVKKYSFESCKPYLQNYFRVRNCIWKNDRIETKEKMLENLSAYPKVIEILDNPKYILPNTPEKFPAFLISNQRLVEAVFGISKEYNDNRINFIEALASRGNSANYRFTDKIKKEELQTIFRDILYTKNFVRNKLNHASEKEELNEEMICYFKKYGYKTGIELSVKEISDMLYKSMKRIRENLS